MIPPRVRRTLVATAALLTFVALAGATYQGVETAIERRQFPHPGRLIDVGGHQLHLHCAGEGTPTVLLEAPAAGMSAAWGWVQRDVTPTTRVCSYDRAGLGWSEAGDAGYDPAAVAGQLHTLVQRADERGPYVLVGHGLGAAFATVYASRFGDELTALVLIDPPSEPTEAQIDEMTRLISVSPWLARAGLLRATRLLSDYAAGLPEPSAGAFGAFLNRPDHLTRAARELARRHEAMDLATAAAPHPRLHVITVETEGPGVSPFLTHHEQASIASRAILDAVADSRRPGEIR